MKLAFLAEHRQLINIWSQAHPIWPPQLTKFLKHTNGYNSTYLTDTELTSGEVAKIRSPHIHWELTRFARAHPKQAHLSLFNIKWALFKTLAWKAISIPWRNARILMYYFIWWCIEKAKYLHIRVPLWQQMMRACLHQKSFLANVQYKMLEVVSHGVFGKEWKIVQPTATPQRQASLQIDSQFNGQFGGLEEKKEGKTKGRQMEGQEEAKRGEVRSVRVDQKHVQWSEYRSTSIPPLHPPTPRLIQTTTHNKDGRWARNGVKLSVMVMSHEQRLAVVCG